MPPQLGITPPTALARAALVCWHTLPILFLCVHHYCPGPEGALAKAASAPRGRRAHSVEQLFAAIPGLLNDFLSLRVRISRKGRAKPRSATYHGDLWPAIAAECLVVATLSVWPRGVAMEITHLREFPAHASGCQGTLHRQIVIAEESDA